MSDAEAPPEPDVQSGAPHPRFAEALFGQGSAETAFLDAHATGRLHHAWLITGPPGIGKATLAWRIAAFLLAEEPDDGPALFGAPPPPTSLTIDPEHPVKRRMRALSEGRLFLLRRPWDDRGKRLKQDITVDEVRKLKSFFGLSAAEGQRRVVIVDAADEMNRAAANALLKVLEEPPARTVLLLVSHQPSRLLPTIRSRCRTLQCAPLGPDDLGKALVQAGFEAPDTIGLTTLAEGSAGRAIRMIEEDGQGLYARLVALLRDAPSMDRTRAIALCDDATSGGPDRVDLLIELIALFLGRLAHAGALRQAPVEAAPHEAETFARLAPSVRSAQIWADLSQELTARAAHGRAVNLDPSALLLDMVLKMNATATEACAA